MTNMVLEHTSFERNNSLYFGCGGLTFKGVNGDNFPEFKKFFEKFRDRDGRVWLFQLNAGQYRKFGKDLEALGFRMIWAYYNEGYNSYNRVYIHESDKHIRPPSKEDLIREGDPTWVKPELKASVNVMSRLAFFGEN